MDFPGPCSGILSTPYSWIIQVADLAGVYLVSLLVMAGNAAILGTFWLKSLRPLVIFAAVFLAANLYGAYRLHFWQPESGPALQVALVQPNIGLTEEMEHHAGKYFNTLAEYFQQAVDGGAQWVIFPRGSQSLCV